MTKKRDPKVTEIEKVEISQDRIDRVIWRGIGVRSVRQIAEEAGIKPEEVLRRKGELLDEIDVLSVAEKRVRIMAELDGMARDARERAARVSDEFASGLLNSSVAAMKTVLGELARLEKADNSKVAELNQKRVAELVSLMREVIDISVVEIAASHELDEQELYDVFNRRMREAAEKRDLA